MTISIREVSKEDWDFILELRNNSDIRKFMNNDTIISKDRHYQYLEKQNSNPKFLQRIICFESKDVGYVRILDGDISIYVNPSFHGKGIATKALELIEPEAKKHGFRKLIGKVFATNLSSKQIFLNNGYVHTMDSLEKNI